MRMPEARAKAKVKAKASVATPTYDFVWCGVYQADQQKSPPLDSFLGGLQESKKLSAEDVQKGDEYLVSVFSVTRSSGEEFELIEREIVLVVAKKSGQPLAQPRLG